MNYILNIPATRNGAAFTVPTVLRSTPEKVDDLLNQLVRYLNDTANNGFHIDECAARATLAEFVLQ